jgi:hypothetical protein
MADVDTTVAVGSTVVTVVGTEKVSAARAESFMAKVVSAAATSMDVKDSTVVDSAAARAFMVEEDSMVAKAVDSTAVAASTVEVVATAGVDHTEAAIGS